MVREFPSFLDCFFIFFNEMVNRAFIASVPNKFPKRKKPLFQVNKPFFTNANFP